MARDQSDRENLLAEATALVERAEIAIEDGRTIVVGFRRDSSFSVFFDSEPVFQFNAAGELRRAYYEGRLIKAELGKLIALDRQRADGQVQLVRDEFDDARSQQFIQAMSQHLEELTSVLESDRFRLVGQVSPNADVMQRARDWLSSRPEPPTIAQSPRV